MFNFTINKNMLQSVLMCMDLLTNTFTHSTQKETYTYLGKTNIELNFYDSQY